MDMMEPDDNRETIHLPRLSRIHLKRVQSRATLTNNGMPEQAQQWNARPQTIEALTIQDMISMQPTQKVSVATASMQSTQKLPAVAATSSMQPTQKLPVAATMPRTGSAVSGASNSWGWLPILSLTSALGIFLVALAADAGRFAIPQAELIFWIGLIVLFLPIVARLLFPGPSRRERLSLVLIRGGGTYLFRFLDYPLYFAYIDEFMHWLGANDIAATGHLFHINQINPVASFYPGMEIVTNAISDLTGLSPFGAGSIVLLMSGIMLTLSLYLFFECLSNSPHLAGIATVLYMANPGWFSDTQFAYESLALPLAMFVLFVVARRSGTPANRRWLLALPILLGMAATVITHHLTSFTLEGFFLLWTGVFLFIWLVAFIRRSRIQPGPRGVAIIGLALIVAWTAYTGWRVIPYLFTPFAATVTEAVQAVSGKAPVRHLFQDGSGYTEPLWERVVGFTSSALISLGLPFGLFQLWRRYRTHALAIALAIAAVAYPFSLLVRLTPAGTVTATRAPVSLFVGVAFVLALGITKFWLSAVPGWKRYTMVTIAVAIIFIGGWVIGTSPSWYRLPGPYLVSADHRSVDPESINAAEWTLAYLGPGNRIASDRSNYNLLVTFGQQWIVTSQDTGVEIADIFFTPQFGAGTKGIIRYANIQYLLVDHRLSTDLPRMGTYFDRSEPDGLYHTTPIPAAALDKFDGVQNVSRIFDSGNIVIYDVEAIISPTVNTPVASPCKLGPSPAVSSSPPMLASTYTGTIDDIATGQKTAMSLSGIQQQQGSFCATFAGLGRTTLVSGSIEPGGQINFMVKTRTGQVIVTFSGLLLPDGVLSGNYCRVKAKGCSDYGLWSLSSGA